MNATSRRHAGAGVELDRLFGYQPTSTSALPDPAPLLENLARSAIEIILGVRDVDQVSRWVDEATYQRLAKRALLARRARALRKTPASHVPIRIASVRAQHPADGVVEGVIVVQSPVRARVVAVRLEGLDERWRATALTVL